MAHTATCINTHILCGAHSNLYKYTHPVWDIQPVWIHTSCIQPVWILTSCMGHTTCMNTLILYGGIQPPVWMHTHLVWGIQPPVWRYTHILYGAYSHLCEYTHPVWGIQQPVWIHTSCMGHTTCINTHILYGAYSHLCEDIHTSCMGHTATCVKIYTHPVWGIQPPVWRYTHILYGAYSHLYEYTHPVRNIQQCKGAMIRRCKLPQEN